MIPVSLTNRSNDTDRTSNIAYCQLRVALFTCAILKLAPKNMVPSLSESVPYGRAEGLRMLWVCYTPVFDVMELAAEHWS